MSCNWRTGYESSTFYELGACSPDVSNAEYSSVCEENGNSITLTYTMRTPLRNDVNYQISCVFPV